MKQSIILLPLCILFLLSSIKANGTSLPEISDIHGLWIENGKQKVAVWIENCEDQLCGRIFWLKKPFYADGKPKLDSHNPDEALRNTPRCGLKILDGFSPAKNNTWNGGKIYNPSDGRTYSSTIHLAEDGTLKVRGYIGIPLFGKTTKWQRPLNNLTECS